jgi:Fasciclin domain
MIALKKIRWFFLTALLALWAGASPARMVVAEDAPALIRFVNLAAGLDFADLYIGPDRYANSMGPGLISPFSPYAPATYDLALVRGGGKPENAVATVAGQSFLSQHHYTVAVVGNKAADDLQLLIIDETAALGDNDPAKFVLVIGVNGISGSPVLDFTLDKKPIIEGIQPRAFGTAVIPVSMWENVAFATPEEPGKAFVPISEGEGFFEPYTVNFYGLFGQYPGELFTNYYLMDTHHSIAPDPLSFLQAFNGLALTSGGYVYEFTTFLSLVEKAGLTDALKQGGLTIFAPTDQAFEKVPANMMKALEADPEQLQSTLLRHIFKTPMNFDDLLNAGELEALNGEKSMLVEDPDNGGFTVFESFVFNYGYVMADGSWVWFPDDVFAPPQ